MAGPLISDSVVKPEWVDFNGHMQDAYYLLIFSTAVEELMDALGMDHAYRTETKGTIYTLELHLHYVAEVHQGAPVRCETRLLDADQKRLHIWQELAHGQTGQRLSVCEQMLLHVSQADDAPGSAPFPSQIQAKVDAMLAGCRDLPEADLRAGAIGIRRRS
jgi:acyl-CoA thioester hydrolase